MNAEPQRAQSLKRQKGLLCRLRVYAVDPGRVLQVFRTKPCLLRTGANLVWEPVFVRTKGASLSIDLQPARRPSISRETLGPRASRKQAWFGSGYPTEGRNLVRLLDSEAEEHAVEFRNGRAAAIVCPNLGRQEILGRA